MKSDTWGCPMSDFHIGQTGQDSAAAFKAKVRAALEAGATVHACGGDPAGLDHGMDVQRVRERRSPSRGIRRRGDRNEVLPAHELDVATLDWFLVRVLAGQEISARDILRAAGFGTCLPMQRKWQRANRYHKRREQR